MKVLIPQDINEAGKNWLRDKGYEVVVGQGWDSTRIKAEIVDCDAVLARTAPYPADVIAAGKKLKVIARYGVGTDNVDLKAAAAQGVWVTIAKGANSRSVAEQTIAMMLACAKNLRLCDAQTRAGNWEIRNKTAGIELQGKTLGLLGLGAIGAHVAQIAHDGLRMNILGYDAFLPPNLPGYITVAPDIDTVFRQSDVLSLHVPATPDTINMVNRRTLGLMKPGACLVNCARGEVVNENDLYDALRNQTLGGAASDVFAQEPAQSSNKLFELDNFLATPHNAALTGDANVAVALSCAQAIHDVLTGNRPLYPVNNPVLK